MTEKKRKPAPPLKDAQESGKRGKTSDARKQGGTRYGTDPAPETSPTPGASGQPDEGRERGELRDIGGKVRGEPDPGDPDLLDERDLEEVEKEEDGGASH